MQSWLTLGPLETPFDSPLPSGSTTPRHDIGAWFNGPAISERLNFKRSGKKPSLVKNSLSTDSDSDIDPDDLLAAYLDCKTKLFTAGSQSIRWQPRLKHGPETAKLERKVERIESDVLFDKYMAGRQWEARRIVLEKKAAEARRTPEEGRSEQSDLQESETLVDSEDDASREAAKLGAALMEDSDNESDGGLTDLFASLPVNEIDPTTGESSNVINGSSGVKIIIRDFGKWTGVSPTQVLEETCRARYVSP